jgi:hypothetical protein
VRTCFDFLVGRDSLPGLPPFEEVFLYAAAIHVLGLIVAALGRKGFRMTEPKLTKTNAYSLGIFTNYRVDLDLIGVPREDSAHFSLLTLKLAPSSQPEVFQKNIAEWENLCESLNQILTDELNAKSLPWLTSKDAEALWSRARGKRRPQT